MSMRRVRFTVDDAAPFAMHGEGLTIEAMTRKSEVPVTVEIEGISRRMLLQLRRAIRQELARRKEYWKEQRELMLREREAGHESSDKSEQPAA
jgi:hypothetical protein